MPLMRARVALRQPQKKERLRPTPSVLLFDLDGTLVDTMQAFADLAAGVMARRFGVPERTARKLYLETSGIPFQQQLEGIFGDQPVVPEAALEYETRKHAIAAAAEMDADTRGALDELRARGLRLVVSSNGMQTHVDAFAAREGALFDLALGFGGVLAKGGRTSRSSRRRSASPAIAWSSSAIRCATASWPRRRASASSGAPAPSPAARWRRASRRCRWSIRSPSFRP